ncbi:HAD-IIB family hydrolase [Paenibacillus hodogayensis]|uniref:HAD-IIB family hydrolase n=1 Tax=Paenibacillus hodogayensis TaxID=279208 RepID=A0ABV5W484_9BACL
MQFVFDLDGTICFKGRPISEPLVLAIDKLIAAGHDVIFASARPIRDMMPVVHEKYRGRLWIGGNGSLASGGGAAEHVHAFPAEQLEQILQLIRQHEATYLIDSDWDYAYTGAADHPILNNLDTLGLARNVALESLERIVKVLILTASDIESLNEKLLALDVVVHRHGNERILDISPQNVHKWTALQKAGVQPKQFVAFGNDANDISMFREALHSVRIGEHPGLGEYASDSIPLEGDYESDIVRKIEELAVQYAAVR